VGKFALIQHQRYAHAKQFKRANRALKKLRTYLGRVIRDVALEAAFTRLLALARRVRNPKQHQRGPKVYSLHAPRRSSASAKARPTGLTSSASKSRSPPRSATPRAASSSPI
jgi:hypothetical protein